MSRIRDKKHLAFIRTLICCVCGLLNPEAAHIRIYGKGGTALKTGDNNVVPLCNSCHRTQHAVGERTFWGDRLSAAINLASELYKARLNKMESLKLIWRFRT
jgi:5-methylcytosine-specific restriction endonuclease McrA